ncbi:MAG: PD40 domain-containing protein [Planctomycetes bacterium]|nr:PD40 domain-containing protein [Planctomycetota bacterium]
MGAPGSWRAVGIGVCATLALGAVAGLALLRAGRPVFHTDGEVLWRADALADAPMVVWDRAMPQCELPGPVRGRVQELPDGRLVYGRAVDAGRTTLVAFDPRLPGAQPVPLVLIDGPGHDFSPSLDRAGRLLFASDRPGGRGGFDLWAAPPAGGGRFATPRPLPDTVNTAADEVDPAPAPDGVELAFVRRFASVAEGRNGELWIADLTSAEPARPLDPSAPSAAERVRRGLPPAIDRDPAFASDGAALWFVRQTAGGEPVLHRATRHRGALGGAVPVAGIAGADAALRGPAPSDDGFTLHCVQSRGDRPLWVESRARLVHPWWPAQVPIERALWIALACAVLVGALLGLGARWRHVDIVTWCLLLSALLHLLAWLWFGGLAIMTRELPVPPGDERLAIRVVAGAAPAGAAAGTPRADAPAARAQRSTAAPQLDLRAPAGGALPAAGSGGAEPTVPAAVARPAAALPAGGALADAAGARLADAVVATPTRAGRDAVARAAAGAPPPAPGARAVPLTAPAGEARPPAAAVAALRIEPPGSGAALPAGASSGRAAPVPSAAVRAGRDLPAASHQLASARGAPTLGDAPAALGAARRAADRAAVARAGVTPAGTGPRAASEAPVPSRAVGAADAADGRTVDAERPASALGGLPAAESVGPTATARGAPVRAVVAAAQRSTPQGPALRDAPPLGSAAEASGGRREAVTAAPLAGLASTPLAARDTAPDGPRRPVGPQAVADFAAAAAAPTDGPLPVVAEPPGALPRAGRPRDAVAAAAPPPGVGPAALRDAPAATARAARDEPGRAAVATAALPALEPPGPVPLVAPARGAVADLGVVAAGSSPPPSALAPLAAVAVPGPRSRADAAPIELYANRFGPRKAEALERFGGNVATERAVAAGLEYLADRQCADGLWGQRRDEHEKYGETEVGKSALCVLAFLGAGHTPASGTEHSVVVARAIDALLAEQDPETGHFGRTSSYSHGIATYALAECHAMSRDPKLRAPLQRAVDWILHCQDQGPDPRSRGGWGYFSPVLRPEDGYARSSITAWMVMALESARLSGIAVPPSVLGDARTFLRRMFDARSGVFLYSREPGRLRSSWRTLPGSTPAAVFCLLLLGDGLDDEMLAPALQFTLERRPRSWRRPSTDAFVLQGAGNVYFWYYGTLATFLAGGDAWATWNRALQETVVDAQRRDGSWRPIGAYAEQYAGDRDDDACFTTAMTVLSLEVYYRYFTPLLERR